MAKHSYSAILEELLLAEHSRVQADLIIEFIGAESKKLDALAAHCFGEDQLLAQRAAWPLGIIGTEKPIRIVPYLKEGLAKIEKDKVHDAVKRNIIRTISLLKELPENIESESLNICFDLLADPKEAIAIKVFAMTALYNLSKKYPEISNELKILIEEQMPNGSAGFQNRGKKILKKLD